jgi:hypothetical protein
MKVDFSQFANLSIDESINQLEDLIKCAEHQISLIKDNITDDSDFYAATDSLRTEMYEYKHFLDLTKLFFNKL